MSADKAKEENKSVFSFSLLGFDLRLSAANQRQILLF